MRAEHLAHNILEVIDFSDNGVSLLDLEQTLKCAISFRQLVMTVNALRSHGLITIDANHIAHRVRT